MPAALCSVKHRDVSGSLEEGPRWWERPRDVSLLTVVKPPRIRSHPQTHALPPSRSHALSQKLPSAPPLRSAPLSSALLHLHLRLRVLCVSAVRYTTTTTTTRARIQAAENPNQGLRLFQEVGFLFFGIRNMASKAMNLAEDQIQVLEKSFQGRRHPDETSLMLIAAECGLSEEETRRWFEQRNAQWRQAEGLPAERGSVLD
ncbi:uncharacterized protein V6R79_020855 [Siganus canaliculatus]